MSLVLLLPDTSNPIPAHREQFHSDNEIDFKNNIPDCQENHQSFVVPTKTAQDHDLNNNVVESVIPPTPENVQLNSSMTFILTNTNNETKSINHEIGKLLLVLLDSFSYSTLVTDTVHHPRYFSLLSYLEHKGNIDDNEW